MPTSFVSGPKLTKYAESRRWESGNISWNDPYQITLNEGQPAFIRDTKPGISEFLIATNFLFDIPYSAVITGIEVSFDRNVQNKESDGPTRDYVVSLLKNNNPRGDNKADTGNDWKTDLTTATYGGSGDLWGEPWDAYDINDSTFGLAISVELNIGAKTMGAEVYNVFITIYYDDPDPIARPFAVSADSAPGGTRKVTSCIIIGTSLKPYAADYGGLKWYNGPNEYNRYIIAFATEAYSYPTFWGTKYQTDQSYIDLVNYLSGMKFNDVSTANTWVIDNDYWSTYGI